jgi:hypothetical protein
MGTSANRDGSLPLFAAILLWFVCLWILVCGAAWAWSMKDGLGPDSVESHGLLAWQRFWVDFRWTFGFGVAPTFVLGMLCYWWDYRSHVSIIEK